MGKQSIDALLVDFITNFDIDMMDATVAYCIVLYCNHRNEHIASCGSLNNVWYVTHTMDRFTTCTCWDDLATFSVEKYCWRLFNLASLNISEKVKFAKFAKYKGSLNVRDLQYIEVTISKHQADSPFYVILRGNKVSMLTHTYRHKPLRKIKVTICNHQADIPLCV